MSEERCTTHHHACDCREAHFERMERELSAENERLRKELNEAYERAAKVCEKWKTPFNSASENADKYRAQNHAVDSCAQAIRALKK